MGPPKQPSKQAFSGGHFIAFFCLFVHFLRIINGQIGNRYDQMRSGKRTDIAIKQKFPFGWQLIKKRENFPFKQRAKRKTMNGRQKMCTLWIITDKLAKNQIENIYCKKCKNKRKPPKPV